MCGGKLPLGHTRLYVWTLEIRMRAFFLDGIIFQSGRAYLCLNSEVLVLPSMRPNLRDKFLSVGHLK
jgi:hypothetical protein